MTTYALHVAGDCGDPCPVCDHEAELELQEQLDIHDCFARGCTNPPTQRVDGALPTDRPWYFCDEHAVLVNEFLDTCPHTPLCLETDRADCLAQQREEGPE